jgi:hypothetical protein
MAYFAMIKDYLNDARVTANLIMMTVNGKFNDTSLIMIMLNDLPYDT